MRDSEFYDRLAILRMCVPRTKRGLFDMLIVTLARLIVALDDPGLITND